jgi:hypothetical protein
MLVELTRLQARYLSVLAAQDINRERGLGPLYRYHVKLHSAAREALQPACEWESEEIKG